MLKDFNPILLNNIKTIDIKKTEPLWLKIIALFIILAISAVIAILIPYYANDFPYFYRAGSVIAAGHSPYIVPGFYSPIWVALLFVPFSFFSMEIAYRIYAAILFGASIYIFWKLSNERVWITFIACFSPFLYMMMQYGNIEWLVLIGLITPTPIGLWFLLVKPQMGFVAVLLLAWKSYKQQGIRRFVLDFFPVALGLAISYLLGMRIPVATHFSAWSADIWPYGLLLGTPGLIIAFKNRDDKLALAVAPFLTPYVGTMSWVAILPKSMQSYRKLAIGWVLSWAIVLIWRFHLH